MKSANQIYEPQSDKNNYFLIFPFTNCEVVPHFHKALEFVYCVKGEMEVMINGNKYILRPNEIYVAPSYSIHSHKILQANEYLVFVFAHNYYHDFEKSFPNKELLHVLKNHEENKKIYQKMLQMFQVFTDYNFLYENIPFLYRQALINEFLFELSKTYPLQDIKQKTVNNSILEILSYINQHYTENFSLESLAQKYNYSPKYFSEFFNKNVGCNLHTYVNNVRIDNALLDLNNPENKDSITQIAFKHGFNSLATFYRVLQRKNPEWKKS
jgi:AraC-like DNA-binding protein